MAHIFEFLTPDKRFTPKEIVQEKITELMVQMYQYKELVCDTPEDKATLEYWRDELHRIRMALDNI